MTPLQERLRELLESAQDAMVIVDPQSQIVLVNAQFERLFGYASEDRVGQPVQMLVRPRLRPKHPQHRATYFSDPRARPMGVGMQLYGLRKDGSELLVEISRSPLETEEGFVSSAIRGALRRSLRPTNRRMNMRAPQKIEPLKILVVTKCRWEATLRMGNEVG